jgi:hypothetical protein
MDQDSSKVARSARWSRLVVLWLLVVALVLILQVGGFFWWPPELRGWIAIATTLPIVIPLLVAVVIVGAQAPAGPWIRRDSVLWRWVNGVGAAFGALVGVGVGALLGAIVGAGVATSDTIDGLVPSLQIVVAVIGIGVFAAVVWWSLVAAIDMHRLGLEQRAKAARRSALLVKTKHAKRTARVVSEWSGPLEVGLCGLLTSMLIAQLWVWANSALGAL